MTKINASKKPAPDATGSAPASVAAAPFPTSATVAAAKKPRAAKPAAVTKSAVASVPVALPKAASVKARPAAVKAVVAKPVAAAPAGAVNAKAAAKPVKASASTKVAAKPAVAKSTALKAAPAKPAAKSAVKPAVKIRVAKVAVSKVDDAAAREKARKPKLVRDSFTMPEPEYAVLGQVKKACLKAGFEIKKSELLRIGVALISQIDLATLQSVLAALPQLKTGRPKKA